MRNISISLVLLITGVCGAQTQVDLAHQTKGVLPLNQVATPGLLPGSNVTFSGTWPNITINSSGSGGGLTSFTSGNLSPLFTTTLGGSPTTTPALVFTLSTAAANTVLGNFTGSPAAPTFSASPAFSAANLTGLPISTGVSGLGAGIAAFLATPSTANLAAAVTGETGTGALVFGTSPTLVTPALGTPTALVLTNATGLPVGGLSATGTPSSTTFLRGDNTWATPSGGSGLADCTDTSGVSLICTVPITAPEYLGSGTTPAAYSLTGGTGSLPHALPASSAGFVAPVPGGTSYLIQCPATMTAGIFHFGAPATVYGVNVSQCTSSAVSLTADVSGVLPIANGGTNQSSIAPSTLTDGTTIAFVGSSGFQQSSVLTLIHTTTTRTLNISGFTAGSFYVLVLKQDSTGVAGTFNLGTGCTWFIGGTSGFTSTSTLTLASSALAINIAAIFYDGTNCYVNLR